MSIKSYFKIINRELPFCYRNYLLSPLGRGNVVIEYLNTTSKRVMSFVGTSSINLKV